MNDQERAEAQVAEPVEMCDHICLKPASHVEEGSPHFYGYELPSPRLALSEVAQLKAELEQVRRSKERIHRRAQTAEGNYRRLKEAAQRFLASRFTCDNEESALAVDSLAAALSEAPATEGSPRVEWTDDEGNKWVLAYEDPAQEEDR